MSQKCSDAWTNQYDNIIQQITDLQQTETDVFQKLRGLAAVSPDTREELEGLKKAQESLKDVIRQLTEKRKALYTQLKKRYNSAECGLSADRKALSSQISMVEVVEFRLNEIKKQINDIEMRQDNKMRMVEIGNYENDRYESHKNIFRNIAFACLAILIGVFVSKRGFTRIGNAILILAVGIGIIMTAGSIYDNYWRDNRYWNRYSYTAGAWGESGDDCGGGGERNTEIQTGTSDLKNAFNKYKQCNQDFISEFIQ